MSDWLYRMVPAAGGILANCAICAMAILVVVVAALRYGFNWTPGWGDSVCAFLVVFAVFMGAGHTLIKGEHVRILFVFKSLPRRVQPVIETLCGVLSLLYVGYLIYSTTDLALMSYRLNSRTPDGLLLFPMQICLPIGLFMLFVALLGFTFSRAKQLVRREPSSGESGGEEERRVVSPPC